MPNLPILLGDSIFRRLFCQTPLLFNEVSKYTCIGGLRILGLYDKVKQHRHLLADKEVILLIGTNDILKGESIVTVRQSFKVLIRYLKRLKCRISICEVLPIPKFGRLATDCQSVCELNKFIRSFEPSGVCIIRVHDQFVSNNNIKVYLYCQTCKRKNKSQCVDLIHPNGAGLECLLLCLEVNG